MTRIDGTRYAGHWDLMAKLARWLLNSRAGRYAGLIEAGKMTADEAFVDETARKAIDGDWRAITTDTPRDDAIPDCSTGWKIGTLSSAVATLSDRARMSADHADLRDATHHLFSMYRSGHVGLVLRHHQARRAARQLGEQPCN